MDDDDQTVRRRRWRVFSPRALRWAVPAVTVALVLALLLPGSGGPTHLRDGLTFAADDLEQALDGQLIAEQRLGSETRILLSFADHDGSVCRAFVRADLSGIACRRDGGWHLRVQRDGIDVGANDSRQAASVERSIAKAADSLADGRVFDWRQERAAKASSWRLR